ncbi:Nitrogen permease regulator 3 [Elasticomyces elasticus]|nr:Nitrogen permease regulator 3 [Elasticomyces elasticus]
MPQYTHSTLPPNPSLLAILLVIKSRIGPRLVFHYPQNPSPTQSHSTSTWHGGSTLSSTSSDSSGDDDSPSSASGTDSGDDGLAKDGGGTSRTRRTMRSMRESEPDDEDDDDDGLGSDNERNRERRASGNSRRAVEDRESGRGERAWERVLGNATDGLEKLLSPPRGFHKRRWEVSLEDLVFLGYPVFANEEGGWEKRKRKRRMGKGSEEDSDGQTGDKRDHNDDLDAKKDKEESILSPRSITWGEMQSSPVQRPMSALAITEQNAYRTSGQDTQGKPSAASQSYSSQGATSEKSASIASGNGSMDDMTMFNVVFVLNPPALEHHVRVLEMYENVVKKFSKALKFEQIRSGYVWTEAKKILTMKLQAKENILWPRILITSPLARSIAEVYDSISVSKIAHVSIAGAFETSLQIPQAVSTPYVPTLTERQMPGLWLTTATMIDDDDIDTALSPHSALLLLEDKEVLLKEIEGDAKQLSAPLAFLIRENLPTKSLQKMSVILNISLSDIQFLARHLIYWRRARAVPPLHQKDTYIVSPNADVRRLGTAAELYAQKFSALPSLPRMLQLLSGTPRPYGAFHPSKDHRPAYMEILAWLLRGGWVTQLRTFGWVKVSPGVKAAVATEMMKEAALSVTLADDDVRDVRKAEDVSNDERHSNGTENNSSEEWPSRSHSIMSPQLTGLLTAPRPDSDAGSISSDRTAVPVHSQISSPLPPRPSPLGAKDDVEFLTSLDDTDDPLPAVEVPTRALYDASLILSPHKANTEESRWLAHIRASFADEELRELWPMLYKYFDGNRALEEIAPREGMKRSRVGVLINKLREADCLMVVRHW